MIRKQIIFCSLLIGSLLHAESAESVLGINVGMTSTKNDSGAKFDNPTIGLSYQDSSYVVMPRVDLDYVKLKNEQATSLLKGSINGVYEFENSTNTTPYALAGVGYEYVSGETKDVFESHPFVQGGVGVNIALPKEYKFNVEGKYLQILGGNNEENELIVTVGVTMPLERKKTVKKSTPPIVQPIIHLPVLVSEPIKEEPIKKAPVDSDGDGIKDTIDQCPDTPPYSSVDNYGCPLKITLKINFETNSADVRDYSISKIDNFAEFLLKNKGTLVTIVGHTDSVGSKNKNKSLSQRRADVVKHMLEKRGVSSARLHAEGRGESMPIASNATVEGRAKNRRIEAELNYVKGRR